MVDREKRGGVRLEDRGVETEIVWAG